MEKLLKVTEAAERLNISRFSVYKLVKAGKIGHCCLGAGGKGMRIREIDVQQYIEQRYSAADEPVETEAPADMGF